MARRGHGGRGQDVRRQDTLEQTLGETLDVEVVRSDTMVSNVVRNLIQKTEHDLKVYGLDCEWDVAKDRDATQRPDILQIATVHGFCAIFKLHLMPKIPPALRDFLEDPTFAKVGVDIVDNCEKLKMSYNVSTEGVLDLRHLADELDIPPKGLNTLTSSVLGFDLSKFDNRVQHWTNKMNHLQKQYAALKAVYSARVFYKLSHDRISQLYQDEWQNWDNEEYNEKSLKLWEKYIGKDFDSNTSRFNQKSHLEFILTLGDLNNGTNIPNKKEQEPEDVPQFRARFARKTKAEKKAEKAKKVPMRYLKKFLNRLAEKGMSIHDVPLEVLPRKVLDREGKKVDMEAIENLRQRPR